ncbi:MAG: hypothetical protein ACI9JN_002696 [Bacteroidia bacterium]|jgi:hypothetical protein
MDKKGYPTISKTRGGIAFLGIHYYRSNDYLFFSDGVTGRHKYMDSITLQAVKDGLESNREYAYMKDSGCKFGRDVILSTYGVFIKKDRDGKIISSEILDIKNIDKRRAEIFLPPLWVDAFIYGFKLPEGYSK